MLSDDAHAGPRASAAISAFSILVTLTVVALACGISACIKRRRRHRARYNLFPTDMFNTRDLNWYPPSDYRTAVVGNGGEGSHAALWRIQMESLDRTEHLAGCAARHDLLVNDFIATCRAHVSYALRRRLGIDACGFEESHNAHPQAA